MVGLTVSGLEGEKRSSATLSANWRAPRNPLSQQSRKIARILLGLIVVAVMFNLAVGMGESPAWADGAFPDAQAVLLPRDRPRQTILASTFGLIVSEDDGATWAYACENEATKNGALYVVGPPPADRIFAKSDRGAVVSENDGCAWSVGAGALANAVVTDVFPDPTDGEHVLAIAIPGPPEASLAAVFSSRDGGKTYAPSTFSAPSGVSITGVEVAASDPLTVYMTLDGRLGTLDPMLVRSVDGGQTWTTRDLQAALGPVTPRLMAVDPADANRLYLRLISAPSATLPFEGIAMTTDGGVNWTQPLLVAGGAIAGFVRLPSGVLLAAGTTTGGEPAMFRSTDNGLTFATSRPALHPFGLAQRDGVVYVATKDVADGFALATSADGGLTFRGRMKLADVSAIRSCVKMACQSDCAFLAGLKLFPAGTCQADPTSPVPKTGGGGCACALNAGSAVARYPNIRGLTAFGLLLATVVWVRRRRSRS